MRSGTRRGCRSAIPYRPWLRRCGRGSASSRTRGGRARRARLRPRRPGSTTSLPQRACESVAECSERPEQLDPLARREAGRLAQVAAEGLELRTRSRGGGLRPVHSATGLREGPRDPAAARPKRLDGSTGLRRCRSDGSTGLRRSSDRG